MSTSTNLGELIRRQAARRPEAVAIVSGRERVSYRQYSERASRLARRLRILGVGPDTMVAVALDRSVGQLTAVLAVLQAGGVYVPMDPSYPAARLELLLDDVRPRVLITRSDLVGALPRSSVPTVLVDADFEDVDHEDVDHEDAGLDGGEDPAGFAEPAPDRLAYVVHTSGSTGRPKGAMNTRRALAGHLLWRQQVYSLTPNDVVLQKTPVGFDVSVWESLWPLLAGARVVVAEPDGHRDPAYLAALIARHGVTVAHFVPSMLQVFLDTADLSGCGSLRQVFVGGERLSAELRRRFHAAGLTAELDNLYGPAETAIDVTRWRCPRDWAEPTVPIGTAVADTTIRILSPDGLPAADGTAGELCVGGAQVGRGYAGRPALTAERFVPDPFSATPGARLYRTGDRALIRPDGAVEYLGRLDEQVKVRGVRIEPGEIEQVLGGLPGVRACAVTVHGAQARAVLVAYVVGDAEPGALRASLAQLLPEHMVPTVVMRLDALPLNPNGKLDRRALPAPELPARPYAAPLDGLEAELAGLWAEVLETDAVGRDTDFTEFGGTSLHAARVLARIRGELDVTVPMRDFFQAGTVQALAELIRSRRKVNAGPEAAGLPPVAVAGEAGETVPSLSQQRLWFLDQLRAAAGVAYNVPVASRLRGPLDPAALADALSDVVARHEQLRTSFRLDDGGTVRSRVEPVSVSLDIRDLRQHADPEKEALRLAAEQASEHFDLSAAPPLSSTLLRIAEDDHLLVLVAHHMVADGWTVDILDRELSEAYRARRAGERPSLAPLSVEYRDFARWQRLLADSPALAASVDFWRENLAGAPTALDLPTDRERPATRSYRGRRIGRAAPPELAAAIRDLAVAARATPYAVHAAAFGLLLRELTGRRDVLIASPSVGRPEAGLEDVVGFFANTVLARIRPQQGSFRGLVGAVHETSLNALEHQYVPFEQLVARHAPQRDPSRPPLAQVALAVQGRRRRHARLAGLEVRPVELDTGTAKFDLTCTVEEVGDGLLVNLEYSTDLFADERAEAMLERYLAVLGQATANPEVELASLIAVPASSEPGTVVPVDAPAVDCLHTLFAETAQRHPRRIAVSDGERELTYAELDRAANRLAHRLRAIGAEPGRLVGLCANRDVDAVVGLLAILKSGAAYVPLDPRHPAARSAATLEDAGCRILVGEPELCEPLSAPERVLVALDAAAADEDGDRAALPPRSAITPRHPAYVIYTSGSTGKPKGVPVTHANAVRLFTATESEFSFAAEDVWTLFHSLAFDFSVWELWGALLYGGRLVVVPYLVSRDPAAFLRLLREQRVTVLSQTPTAFRQLTAAAEDAEYPELDLRTVVFGGEMLSPPALRGWIDGYGSRRPRLVNMYGITETTVHVTHRAIVAADLAQASSPIGVPIADLRVHILDEAWHELPAGVEGEMYVGGAGVADGYLGRPALTAERFVPDPYGPRGARLYRSGDLAIRRADGGLEFRGRADQQIKLHGFRIEPGEIERALSDQPGIRTAACILREDDPGRPRLVAYLVPSGAPTPHADVRAALAGRLPEHMIPSAFVDVEALPMTVNGKLDRGLLPAPAGPDKTRSGPRAAASTEAERTLLRVWTRVLGVAEPGIHDNFFAQGGDSILAVRLSAAARAAGFAVGVEQIFLHPTVAGLAEASRSEPEPPAADGSGAVSTSLADLDPSRLAADVEDAYPTSAMQLGILYECELAEDPGVYHDLKSVRVTAPFDAEALRRALDALCERHEVLRTSFDVERFREPLQFVHRRALIPLEIEDARGSADGTERLRAWWDRDAAEPFDTALPPLLHCHALRYDEASFQLSISVHHSVLDGWSLAGLMTELLLEYDAGLAGGSADLPSTPRAAYRAFIAAEQAVLADPAAERFWRKMLDAAPVRPLPRAEAAEGGGGFRAELSEPTMARLRAAASGLGLPVKSLLFAAHLHALSELTGDADVVSGLQVNGRLEHEGADRVLGLFLNIVPIRLRVPRGSWAEVAAAAFDAERETQPYRRYPLSILRRTAGRERTVFEAAFNYTDFHVFSELDALTAVRADHWWASDRHSFPVLVEISGTPDSDRRVLEVTTGVESELVGIEERLGVLVLAALERIAENVHAPADGPAAESAAPLKQAPIMQAADSLGSIWFSDRPRAESGERLQLLCLPHAGSGASTYLNWPSRMPAGVDVVSVQLPGRESRFGEPLATSAGQIVDELLEPALDRVGQRFALFGHSMGALLAFELAHALSARGRPPQHLFVSGYAAPQLSRPPVDGRWVHEMSDTRLLEHLTSLEGTPPGLAENEGLMQLLLPILRADFAICELYRFEERPPLRIPITALGGLDDPTASGPRLSAWRNLTTADFSLREFSGGHFYLIEHFEEVVDAIAVGLSAADEAAPAPRRDKRMS